MHKLLTILLGATLSAALVGGAAPLPSGVIARIHFAGAARISADRNSAAFANYFCAADAQALESQTLDKLSRAPSVWFNTKIPPGSGDGVAQLRPLLGDFLKSEWLFETREAMGGTLEYTLAIRLDGARAALWQNNLTGLLQAWIKMPVQKVPNGWQLRKHLSPNLFRFVRTGDWVVIGCGDNELPMTDALLRQLASGQPLVAAGDNQWVSADLDWPRLGQWFPALGKFDFPRVAMQIAGRDGYLKLNGQIMLTQPLPPLEKWRLPDAIHSPLASFTAVRGVGPWLARQGWAQRYEIQPMPDQFFVWALPELPFQTYAAAPVTDANTSLAQLNARLSTPFAADPKSPFMGQITTVMTNHEIEWHGIPFMSAYVQAAHEPAGNYLLGGFFPNSPRRQPLPAELTGQLNVPNLVYYHWEVTSERLKELPELSQLLLLMTQHRQLDANSLAFKWLNRIGPLLGPTATQVIETAPNELAFTRSAPVGLTAVELVALANWLEAPNFPGCDLRLPVRPPHPKRTLSHSPGSPPASTTAPARPVTPH
jgi:hypothetical protein